MLGDLIVNTLGFLVSSAGNLVSSVAPATAIPQFVPGAIVAWGNIVADMSELSHWVPLTAVAQVFLGLIFATTLSFAVRIARIIASAGLGGGG